MSFAMAPWKMWFVLNREIPGFRQSNVAMNGLVPGENIQTVKKTSVAMQRHILILVEHSGVVFSSLKDIVRNYNISTSHIYIYYNNYIYIITIIYNDDNNDDKNSNDNDDIL